MQKTRSIHLIATLVLATASLSTAHAGPPSLPIKKAVDLAHEALAAKGKQNDVWIRSIELQRPTVTSAHPIWVVTWSGTVPGVKEGSKETGLEIDMEGKVVHLVKGSGGKGLLNR
jgi:hypothetical protein